MDLKILASASAATLLVLLWRRRRQPVCFDEPVDRQRIHTVKHTLSKSKSALQLWVADMELRSPPHIVDAMVRRAREPTYGYTIQPTLIWTRAAEWLVARQGWSHAPSPECFVFSANLVTSFANLLRAFTAEHDAVVVMTPAYAPLQDCISGCGRRLVRHPLRHTGRCRVDMDLPKLAETLSLEGVRLLLLLSPHNPTGRVWRATELRALAELCASRGVLVVSDEIWADWVLPADGARPFVPFAAAAGACRHVTLNAPTKTFNLAGTHASYVIIEDQALRQQYLSYVEPATLHFGSAFATTALLAAYDRQPSVAWLDAARAYVHANVTYLSSSFAQHLPGLVVAQPLDATYLLWLDCTGLASRLGLTSAAALEEFWLGAGLCLSPGAEFCKAGHCDFFMRLNTACPRSTLEEVVRRLRGAVADHWL